MGNVATPKLLLLDEQQLHITDADNPFELTRAIYKYMAPIVKNFDDKSLFDFELPVICSERYDTAFRTDEFRSKEILTPGLDWQNSLQELYTGYCKLPQSLVQSYLETGQMEAVEQALLASLKSGASYRMLADDAHKALRSSIYWDCRMLGFCRDGDSDWIDSQCKNWYDERPDDIPPGRRVIAELRVIYG